MKTQVLVPNLPESVADATLITWHKKAGEAVEKDENLVDLETDKVVLEVPAPESGVLVEIMQANGATVTSGNLLAVIEAGAAARTDNPKTASNDSAPLPVQPEIEAHNTRVLSPAVRRIVLENEIDPSQIQGTGKNGRLTKTDVLDYLESHSAKHETPEPAMIDEPHQVASVVPPALGEGREVDSRPEQRVPMTRLRARIAERLIQAQQNAAMLTTFNEVNLRAVMELRNRQKEEFQRKHSVKLGFMSFFVKAATEALKQFPVVNASIDKQDIIYHGYYDIGIAVASDRGLVVPILRNADQLDFAAIEKQVNEFGKKAQEGQLSYEDLSGGTFTITNGGVFGSMMSTPILNPPQSAILGMHAIQERPVVENAEIVVRPMMYLALTYDHRIVDGR
ncbi:MAG: 2-oxoglutarate dehydrogenase complex dihydrolipoyllysine-residue succinyltransferase, partial [Methylococcaceae bacterium]|nr:2-oxoglutarate dehydrogenase complex dihydrolipoyllysine-residue succinyltransferase [Methylococcaceae bacterium]